MTKIAFQDQMPSNNCWGCGPNNQQGLQIKSYWNDEVKEQAVMQWKPAPYYKAGPDHILNGGIISTLIDCHSICTAVAKNANDTGVPISDDIWFVTGTLNVKFLKPTLIDDPVKLLAEIVDSTGKKSIIRCSLYSNGIETARGETIAIRVANDWRNRSSH